MKAKTYRSPLADVRQISLFHMSVKEMVYPIVGRSGDGCRVKDIDGNTYIDISMGFGVFLFGHNAPFIHAALQKEIESGVALGPQCRHAGRAAELLCTLTGCERAAFVNTGTEANMVALRLARLATGREKFVMFRNSYHGHFDPTLARSGPKYRDGLSTADVATILSATEGVPTADGVSADLVRNTLLLDYGAFESLSVIEKIGSQLAAVIVEPIQSRRPYLQPFRFLRRLREITEKVGAALIFDECITGFRLCAGGAQEFFGVRADICTYGKIVGGGTPIGVVAGRKRFLDGIDGGYWTFGDDSFPQSPTTFFAGTFCKNPLTMCAAKAALTHISRHLDLYAALNALTAKFCGRMNEWLVRRRMPLRLLCAASLFRFFATGNFTKIDVMYLGLISRGIYCWEGRNFFLSTAHTETDVAQLESAVKATLEDMRLNGLLPLDLPPFYLTPPDAENYLPVVALQPAGDRLPFFMVHPGVRSALGYAALSSFWPKQQPFLAFADEDSPSEPQSIEEIAERYVASLRRIQPIGPYLIGGWSFGGMIALEMATQLEGLHAERCLMVAMFDENGPGFELFDATAEIDEHADALETADGAKMDEKARTQLRTAHDLELKYKGRVLKNTPIILFKAKTLLSYEHPDPSDPTYGLSRCTRKEVRVAEVPGDHMTMFNRENAKTLCDIIQAEIARIAQSPEEEAESAPAASASSSSAAARGASPSSSSSGV